MGNTQTLISLINNVSKPIDLLILNFADETTVVSKSVTTIEFEESLGTSFMTDWWITFAVKGEAQVTDCAKFILD